jgi:hypothetical protein
MLPNPSQYVAVTGHLPFVFKVLGRDEHRTEEHRIFRLWISADPSGPVEKFRAMHLFRIDELTGMAGK